MQSDSETSSSSSTPESVMHIVHIEPLNQKLKAAHGTPLQELLFETGVEFPCGGNGRCRGCRIRLLEGDLPVNDLQRERLSAKEIAEGWRLACQSSVEGNLTLEIRQWDAAILSEDSHFAFTPQEGIGLVVDLGTTTLVTQLLDLHTGQVLGVRSALNSQGRFGADVMSRVQYAVSNREEALLTKLIRNQINSLIKQLLHLVPDRADTVRKVILAGNTVMHHLFCGLDMEPLSYSPFETEQNGLQTFHPQELGWDEMPSRSQVQFLPCLGSFVGSDLLAGILATGMHLSECPQILIDLGTNGEIVIGNSRHILCASTAAGPAFEGAMIEMGMRAAQGAVWRVKASGENMECDVLGNIPARGICGSGLVDAVAVGLEQRRILPSGRLSQPGPLLLNPNILLTQKDIRQLQLAKGAIAAGARILMKHWGASNKDISRVSLAGAFGNYIDLESAQRIGLLHFPIEQMHPAGNTSLLGAKIAMLAREENGLDFQEIRAITTHYSLNADSEFQDIFVEEMGFPNSKLNQ